MEATIATPKAELVDNHGRLSAVKVREAASGDWAHILQVCAPFIQSAIDDAGTENFHNCPTCKNKSFRLTDLQKGSGVCTNCGKARDGFTLLCWLLSLEFTEAVEMVAKHVTIQPETKNEKSKSHAVILIEQPVFDLPTIPPAKVEITDQLKRDAVGLGIHPIHLAEFRSSGLTDEAIRNSGAYSELDATNLCKILNRKKLPKSFGWTLVFPFFDFKKDDGVEIYCRVKPQFPRIDKNKNDGKEKTVKYESPVGERNRPYIPLFTQSVLDDVSIPLLFTEGEKKALAADQYKFPCIGLIGVWGWKIKNADAMLPELEKIVLQGRIIYVVFDSSRSSNENVLRAEFALAQQIIQRGGIVKIVILPSGQNGEEIKLDDFLMIHGADGLRRLMEAAIDPEPVKQRVKAEQVDVNEAKDDPHRHAKLILERFYTTKDNQITLRSWKESFWFWNGMVYREIPDGEFEAQVNLRTKEIFDEDNREEIANFRNHPPAEGEKAKKEQSEPVAKKVTRSFVSNVISAIRGKVLLPNSIEQPIWLNDHFGTSTTQRKLIAVQNGLLDYIAMLDEKEINDVLLPHSPQWFSSTLLAYPFDLNAKCPKWLAFLGRNLENDEGRIFLLQEWMGYLLTRRTNRQKFLILLGEGNNGKSVTCSAITAFLSQDNVSNIPLEMFGQRFHLNQTIGKLANIIGDVGELDKVCEGALKSFTGGDRMTFERKRKDPIETKPTARLIIACNSIPRFSDRSNAVWRRMIVMPLRVAISDAEKVLGMDEVEWWEKSGELSGMLNWAFIGLARLAKNKHFTIPEICQKAADAHKTQCNPARQFLEERYREPTDEESQVAIDSKSVICVPTDDIYQAYRKWCEESGHQAMGDSTFGKEIARAFPKSEKQRPRFKVEGKSVRKNAYVGITERKPEDEKEKLGDEVPNALILQDSL